MVTALCGSFCIACLHPLTQRYITTVITGRVYGYHDQV
nr:hypothetical protein [Vibrio vulnificus]